MTWQNAFDLGACAVDVYDFSSPPPGKIWSGTLAKGQSASISDMGSQASNAPGTIAVSSAGEVTLSTEASSVSAVSGYQVNVVPSYAHDYAAQLVGASSQITRYTAAVGYINAANPATPDVDFVEWDGVGTNPPSVPDPADLSSLTGQRDLIGFYVVSSAG